MLNTNTTGTPVAGLRRVLIEGAARLVYASADGLHPVDGSLAELLAAGADALDQAVTAAKSAEPIPAAAAGPVLAPVDRQEVWACGVTYQRSRSARMSESVVSDVYERVYDAPRPELFFKAPPYRVTAPGRPLRIRADSAWDVPEPELGLVTTADAQIVGYLVADDMSSREIEGANPLYLPQAKIFDDCLALSDTIVLDSEVGDTIKTAGIKLTIVRGGQGLYTGQVTVSDMRRSFDGLVEHLYRELSHPYGAVLLTGTGIVPPDEVTLRPGDQVTIHIEGVGRLQHGIYRQEPQALET